MNMSCVLTLPWSDRRHHPVGFHFFHLTLVFFSPTCYYIVLLLPPLLRRLCFVQYDTAPYLGTQMERMEKTGGFCYRGRVLGVLALSRSMGDHCLKDMVLGEPYVREALLDLRKGVEHGTHLQRAFVVLACDGLFDVMEDCEVTELVASWTGDLEDAAKQLVQEGYGRYQKQFILFLFVVVWHNVHDSSSRLFPFPCPFGH